MFLGMPGIVMTLGELFARHGFDWDAPCDHCEHWSPPDRRCHHCGRINLA